MTTPTMPPLPPRSQLHASPPPPVPAPPPAPKKKRSKIRVFLSLVGEVLITVGLFLVLYVVWQLWWTTFIADQYKAEMVEGFQHSYPATAGYTDIRRYDDPPLVNPAHGEIYGVFHVPEWDWVELPLAEGVDQWILDAGNAGHYPETAQVGQVGNFAVAAHRNSYGNGFRLVETLNEGHQFIIETKDAYIVYKMYDNLVVKPDESWVVEPVPGEPGVKPTKRIMTMTTCHPEFNNYERFIVWSEMEYWVSKEDGMPAIMREKP